MSAIKKPSVFVQFKRNYESKDLRVLADIIKQSTGINLTPDKNTLIETRLNRRLYDLGLQSLGDYIQLMQNEKVEMQNCIEMLTTHKTEWFREIVHFTWLKEFLGQRDRNQKIKIWSAACSTGPEVYSLLFLLLKEGLAPNQFRILGTDISQAVLNQALNLPNSEEFKRQFDLLLRGCSDKIQLHNSMQMALQSSIKFREFNLVSDHLAADLKFDVIFLRNVLIYFDRPTVHQVCKNLESHLNPGGFLVLGLTESLHNEIPELRVVGNSIYQFFPKDYK